MTKAQKLVVGIPLTAVVLVCGVGWYGATQSERAYQQDLAKLRAMGLPTNARELTERDTGDPATGEMYRDAISQIQGMGQEGSQNLKAFFAWDATTSKADLAKYRAYFQELYPPIEEVSARDSISFERDWSQNYSLLLPEYSGMKSLAQVMAAEGRLRAAERDLDGTIIAIDTLDGIAFHTSSEPTIISALVASAIRGMSFSVKTAALQAFQDDQAAIDRLSQSFEKGKRGPSLRDRLAGELVAGVEFFNSNGSIKVMTGSVEGEPKQFMEYVADFPLVKAGVKRKFVNAWRKAYENMPEEANDYDAVTQALVDAGKKVESDNTLTGKITDIFFPVFSQVGKSQASDDAKTRIVQIGVQLLKEHMKSGKYPADLSGFGDLAIDPCSKKPLIYRPRSDGFTLYSLGADGTDHGGVKVKGRYQDLVLEISNKKATPNEPTPK